MPYSIVTKDGITINNIPDDVPRDDPSLKQRVAEIRAQRESVRPSFGQRAIAGAREQASGLTQLAGRVIPMPAEMRGRADQMAVESREAAEALSAQTPGIDVGRIVGQAAVTAPIGLIGGAPTTVGRAALQGLTQGAAQGAVTPVVGDDFAAEKAQQIATGGAVGLVSGPLGLKLVDAIAGGVRAVARALKGANPQQIETAVANAIQSQGIDWAGLDASVRRSIVDDVAKAGAGATELNPEVIANRAVLRQAGVARPTLAQETQDPTQFGRERFLAAGPEGEALARQRQEQFEQLNQTLQSITARAEVPLDREAAGIRIAEPVFARAAQQKNRVDRLYDIARNTAGRDQPIPATDLNDRVLERLEDKSVLTRLPADYVRMMQQLQNADQPMMTISRAEEVIKSINRDYGDAKAQRKGAEMTALSILRDELEKTIDRAVEKSGDARAITALRAATKAARERFQEMDAIPALKAVADGEIEPDFFMQKFITGPRVSNEQLRGLKRFYAERDPQAWGQVRGQVLDDLYQKATGGSEKTFNLATFRRELAKLEATGRAKVLFEPEEIKQLKNLSEAARLIQGPQGQPPPTGLTGGAFLADRLSRVIRSLGSFKIGIVAEPLANFVQAAPMRSAARAAQAGGIAATPRVVQVPPLPARIGVPAVAAGAAAPVTQSVEGQ